MSVDVDFEATASSVLGNNLSSTGREHLALILASVATDAYRKNLI